MVAYGAEGSVFPCATVLDFVGRTVGRTGLLGFGGVEVYAGSISVAGAFHAVEIELGTEYDGAEFAVDAHGESGGVAVGVLEVVDGQEAVLNDSREGVVVGSAPDVVGLVTLAGSGVNLVPVAVFAGLVVDAGRALIAFVALGTLRTLRTLGTLRTLRTSCACIAFVALLAFVAVCYTPLTLPTLLRVPTLVLCVSRGAD